jgi:hypothetical protein
LKLEWNFYYVILLVTVTFNPPANRSVDICLNLTGNPGKTWNLKNLQRMLVAIFSCNMAESFPRHIRGPACTNMLEKVEVLTKLLDVANP